MTAEIFVIMGNTSGWEVMKGACQTLEEFGVSYGKKAASTYRTLDLVFKYAQSAREKGIKIVIAGASGAAHLPGMVVAKTTLPVVGVPVQSQTLNGLDSPLSIVQMPRGVPVATTAIGKAGAINAGLLAIQMLSMHDLELEAKLAERCSMLTRTVTGSSDQLG